MELLWNYCGILNKALLLYNWPAVHVWLMVWHSDTSNWPLVLMCDFFYDNLVDIYCQLLYLSSTWFDRCLNFFDALCNIHRVRYKVEMLTVKPRLVKYIWQSLYFLIFSVGKKIRLLITDNCKGLPYVTPHINHYCTTTATDLTIWFANLLLSMRIQTMLRNMSMCCALPFSAHALKSFFFDADNVTVVKKKWKCGWVLSVTLIDNDTCYHSCQNLLWTHLEYVSWVNNIFNWPLWWCVSISSIRVQTTLNHFRFVNFPQYKDFTSCKKNFQFHLHL